MSEQRNAEWTKDALSNWLTQLRELYGQPGSLAKIDDKRLHWAIIAKMALLRGCCCAKGPSVSVDDGGSAHFIHDNDCGLPPSPADGGPAPTSDELAAPHSKLAIELAKVICEGHPQEALSNHRVAQAIDTRLAVIRKVYEPKEFALCPVVSCHAEPCWFCIVAAMREFILLPENV